MNSGYLQIIINLAYRVSKPGILLILLSLMPFQVAAAQQLNFEFESLTTEHGLSNNATTAVLQDRYGFIWIGTQNGLNRYDGSSFLVFKHDATNPNSLSSNDITCLLEDSYGNLWIGTGLGLNRFNPETGLFSIFKNDPGNENSLSHNYIQSLLEDREGNIWIGTKGGGLNLLEAEWIHQNSMSFQKIRFQSENPNLYIEAIYQDDYGHIWVGSESNLILINNENDQREIKYFEIATSEVNEEIILNISKGRNGGLLATYHELGIWEFKYSPQKKDLIYKRQLISPETAGLKSPVLLSWSNKVDSRGNLWVGTGGEGILYIENYAGTNNASVQQILKNYDNANSLPDNSIKGIFEDNSGIIWVYTDRYGVAKYNPNSNAFTKFRTSSGYCQNISSIIETRSGSLIIGTNGFDGLFSYKFKGNGFEGDLHPLDWTSSKNIRSIIMDDKGNYWTAENNDGVCVYNTSGNKVMHFLKSKDGSNSLSHNYVLRLFQDSRGMIWIGSWGSSQTGGLDMYDPGTGIFTNFKFDPASESGLSQNIVFSITEDHLGRIWVGTRSEGINVISFKLDGSYTIEKLRNRSADEHSLSSNYINYIFSDSRNNIWVATQNGLNRYDFNSGNFTTIDFLGENTRQPVFNIVEDTEGKLWLGTSTGLVRFDPSGKIATKYDHNNGLFPLDYTFGIKLQRRQGIVFGGLEGLVAFIPAEIQQKSQRVPPIRISDIKISNLDPDLSENALLEYTIPTKDRIVLPHSESSFSIKFAALDFARSDNIRYAYRLDSHDDKDLWHYPESVGQYINYSNLREGEYAFQVDVSDEQGKWSGEPKSLEIIVLPPYYRTKIAFALYLLVTISLVYLFISLFLKRQAEKNRAVMERNERQRIEDMNQLKLAFFTNISHEFRTPLTLIVASIDRMLKPNSLLSDEKKQMLILRVKKNTDRLLRLINQLMDFRKLDKGKLKLLATENDIVIFLRNIFSYFIDQAEINNISFSFKASHESVLVWYDPDKLEKAVFNLLSNAFKHLPTNGEIKLELVKYRTEIHIKVYDNGKGIPAEDIPRIFERFYQVEGPNVKERYGPGTGVGLSLAKDFVDMHKGQINVESTENEATCFTINLLLGSEHLEPDEILASHTDETVVTIDYQAVTESHQLHQEFQDDVENNKKAQIKPHLLVVDDNTDIRNLLKEEFHHQYIVSESENGYQALEQVDKAKPDIIISDVMMPEMDGFEFCKTLKTNLNTSHIPVILLTAKSAVESQIEGLETGADAYVSKPFNVDVLEVQIRKLLEIRQKLKQLYSYSLEPDSSELTTNSVDEAFLSKAISIVEEHLSDPELSVESYCKKIGLAKTTLHEKLKALTGKSTGDFIRSIRLKQAVKLLNKGELNISEVCFSVGFNTVWYFSKCFKAEYGILPSEYLKKKKSI